MRNTPLLPATDAPMDALMDALMDAPMDALMDAHGAHAGTGGD